MRRTIILLAASALLTLTACGTDASSSAAEPEPGKSSVYKLRPDDQWRQSVNAVGLTSWTDDASPSTDELMAMPKDWCTALKDGHSVQWLLEGGGLYPAGEDWGTTKSEAQKLVVLGTEAYCPKQTDRVKAELREAGGY